MTKICFRRSFNSFSRRFQLHRISTSVTEEFRKTYFIFYCHTYIKREKRDRIFQWINEKEWTTPYDQDGTFLSRWKIGTLFFLLISSHLYPLKFNVVIVCNLTWSNKKACVSNKTWQWLCTKSELNVFIQKSFSGLLYFWIWRYNGNTMCSIMHVHGTFFYLCTKIVKTYYLTWQPRKK